MLPVICSRAFGLDQWVTSSWRHVGFDSGVTTRQKPPVLRWKSASMILCARTFGLDQWVASTWRHTTCSLGGGVKEDHNPQYCGYSPRKVRLSESGCEECARMLLSALQMHTSGSSLSLPPRTRTRSSSGCGMIKNPHLTSYAQVAMPHINVVKDMENG